MGNPNMGQPRPMGQPPQGVRPMGQPPQNGMRPGGNPPNVRPSGPPPAGGTGNLFGNPLGK